MKTRLIKVVIQRVLPQVTFSFGSINIPKITNLVTMISESAYSDISRHIYTLYLFEICNEWAI